jgi:hypothetical protein
MARFHKFTGGNNMTTENRGEIVDIQLSEINKRQADELFKLRDVEKDNTRLRKENEALNRQLQHNTDVWKLVGQLMQLVDYKEIK